MSFIKPFSGQRLTLCTTRFRWGWIGWEGGLYTSTINLGTHGRHQKLGSHFTVGVSCTASGDNKDFEEQLAQQLFADEEVAPKEVLNTADIPDDAFTTEVAEEALALMGDNASLGTAWRVRGTSYVQMLS